MGELVSTLNSLSPLGLAGGLAFIIYLQIKQRGRVREIADNHLHGLPEMAESLKRIELNLDAIRDHVVYLRARANGK